VQDLVGTKRVRILVFVFWLKTGGLTVCLAWCNIQPLFHISGLLFRIFSSNFEVDLFCSDKSPHISHIISSFQRHRAASRSSSSTSSS
jgi:hypothetical protein